MYKKLLSDSAIYGLGGVLVKSIAFFTLPIYTRIFSPEEFGIIEMFATLSGILSIFMTMGLDATQSFYFMEAKNKDNRNIKEVTTSILQLRLIIGLLVVALSVIFSSLIIKFTFVVKLDSYYLWIVALSTFFATLVSQSLEIFRLIYKPWHYIGLSFVQTIFSVGFVLLFAYYYDGNIQGYLVGMLCGAFMAMLIGWIATRDYRYWHKFESHLFKEFIKFGLPLIPAGLMIWVMQASDRWFVMNMLGSYETGLYAVGAKFALIVMVAVQTFRKAWWPIAMDMLHKEGGQHFFKVVSLWYVGLGSIAAIALTLISPYLVEFLVDKRYFESWKIIGVLCWGSIFYGFYLLSLIGVFKVKKTYLNIYIHGSGAIVNIVLNYFLIPFYGILGAAIATSVSILVANIAGMIISNWYYKIEWQWLWYLLFISSSWIFIFWYIEVL